MEGILIVNYHTKHTQDTVGMHAEPPLEDSLAVFFSNHMGRALNSIHDKWWKPGILPLEWEVTDKQKGKVTISMSWWIRLETSSQITFN